MEVSWRSQPIHSLLILQAIKELPSIPELRMPDPNPFIPKNFGVHRKEVDTVSGSNKHANEIAE